MDRPTPASDQKPGRAEEYRRAGPAIVLGTNMVAGMLLFTGLGYWIDRKRGSGLFWTVGGMFLGLVYGVYEVWRAVRLLNEGSGTGSAERKPDPAGQKRDGGGPTAV